MANLVPASLRTDRGRNDFRLTSSARAWERHHEINQSLASRRTDVVVVLVFDMIHRSGLNRDDSVGGIVELAAALLRGKALKLNLALVPLVGKRRR